MTAPQVSLTPKTAIRWARQATISHGAYIYELSFVQDDEGVEFESVQVTRFSRSRRVSKAVDYSDLPEVVEKAFLSLKFDAQGDLI